MKPTLFLAAVLALAVSAKAAPLFETSLVFPFAEKNIPNYRIPALLTAPNGDLLAFAERRNDGIGDIGDHDLVMKRSTDRGRTWGREQDILVDGGLDSTDITLCVDKERGRIFMFYLKDKKKFAYFSSDDSGKNWKGPVIIHDQVTRPEWDRLGLDSNGQAMHESEIDPESKKKSRTKLWEKNWIQRYGLGPGAGGVQLTQGPKKGRLLVPARHKADIGGGKMISISHVIYSDDHGETWKLGSDVADYGNECRMITLPNGDVMMNMRNSNPADGPDNSRRLVAISKDGGDTWPILYKDEALVSTTVHAGLRRYDVPNSPDRDLILFSNPASPIRQDGHPYGRYNLTVRWSRDSGKTWSAGRLIYPHPCSYTDMTVLDDGTIGMVYERAPKGSVHYWDEVQFVRFNLEWLLAPPHVPIKRR